MENIFPTFFTLCLIALISNIICSNFVSKMDIEDMFPIDQISWQLKKLGILFFISLFIYLAWLITTFFLASMFNGSGSPRYPIHLFTDTYVDTSPVTVVMAQALILQSLAILFLILFVYLLALLSRNQLATYFIATVSLVGLILLTGNLVPLAKYLHLFPSTYFHATRVVTHQLAFENINPNITLNMGLLVLTIASISLMILILLIKTHHERHQLFKKIIS